MTNAPNMTFDPVFMTLTFEVWAWIFNATRRLSVVNIFRFHSDMLELQPGQAFVTDGRTNRQTDRRTDGQCDYYMPSLKGA